MRHFRYKYYVVLGLWAITLCAFLSCTKQAQTINYIAMDTVFEIKVYGVSEKELRAIESKARSVTAELDSSLNFFSDKSELAKINSSTRATLSLHTCLILKRALEWYRISKGAFDPTVGPITLLWNINAGEPRLPDSLEIHKALAFVGADKIRIDGCNIQKPEQSKFDLGGIAKGYLTDLLFDSLRAMTNKPFLINAGGTIRGWGKDFIIGIRHPRKEGAIFARFVLPSGDAVATSGDYERYFIYNNKRYHHIMDPRTGKPASGVCEVTIIGENATDADCASTAVFVMGAERGIEFLNYSDKLDGLIIFLDKNENLHYLMSDGMKKKMKVKLLEEVVK